MADVVDKEMRSRMMSGIRAKNTRPEVFLRKGLHALGFRFRLHAKDIPGKPDIVLPKYRALIVVHGCFWHGHGCRYCKTPKTNTAFWQQKIQGNKHRDEETLRRQLDLGWRCLVVWECGIREAARPDSELMIVRLAAEWLLGEDRCSSLDLGGMHRS
ncbi:very short patch repair endonuclease [Niveibacterium sp.]|uniref:very short patch repair endonuclease n=1 Tax=Niveibacterium sp. TaxID=2017444 RepID=UPI0035B45DCC